MLSGEFDRASALIAEAEAPLAGTAATGLLTLMGGHVVASRGLIEEARAEYTRSVDIFRNAGDRRFSAVALYFCGRADVFLGRYDRAEAALNEALPIFRKIGEKRHESLIRGLLGVIALRRGDRSGATLHLVASLETNASVGDRRGICENLEAFANLAIAEPTNLLRACRLLAAASAHRETIGAALMPAERAQIEPLLKRLESELPATVFREAWDTGSRLRLDEAITLALTS